MEKLKMKKSTLLYFSVFFGILFGGMLLLSIVVGDGYMSRVKNLISNASFEKFVWPFITLGFLSEQPPIIEHATIGFKLDNHVVDPTPENGWTGDEYFANVVSQCVFHSQESFEPLCVICKLKDVSGNVIGVGSVELFGEQYIGSSIQHIDLEPDPENPSSLDVQKAHDVQVDICQQNNGCTPGYWRQDQHFGSWTNPPYSPIVPLTTYRDAFELEDLNAPITMKSNGGQGGGPAPTLVDTFGNSADDITLLDAIWAQGGGENKLGRHATAALLNVANPIVPFNPLLDEAEIIRLVQVAYGKIVDVNTVFQAGDFEDIADIFAAANEAGGDNHCPLGNDPLEVP